MINDTIKGILNADIEKIDFKQNETTIESINKKLIIFLSIFFPALS